MTLRRANPRRARCFVSAAAATGEWRISPFHSMRSVRLRSGGALRLFPGLLTGGALALGLGCLAIRFVLGQQQLAQGLQVAAQDAQGHVTLVALFAAIARALQTI